MRSWTLLLLLAALLTTRLRLGNAEGDPLPPSLVDLLRDSPISSVEDLKLLLQQEESNAKEDEEDEHDTLPSPGHGRYVRSLMEAPLAQQAGCKVRIEVMEVTRSMVDRRNANFVLWPSCVEVQRCSGCCNSRLLQCIPIVTSIRYLQVMKIQYINKSPQYDKAIISVEDHVTCRCQLSSSSSSSSTVSIPRSPSQSNPNPLPSPPQKPPPSSYVPVSPPRPVHPALPRTHSSKADLHRHDDLKHNQQHYHPQEHEPVARQWQQGSYTQLVRWTQPRVHQAPTHAQTGLHQTVTGLLGSVSSWPSEAKAEHAVMGSTLQAGHGSGYDRSREETGGEEGHPPDHEQRQQQLLQHQQRLQHQYHQQQYPQQYNHRGEQEQDLRTTQHWLNVPQSDSASAPVGLTLPPKPKGNPTPFPSIFQKDSVTSQQFTAVTKNKQTETEKVSQKEGNEREESGSAISGDSARAELANQGRKIDSKVNREGDRLTEEERRQKLLEMVQSEPEKTSVLHPHQHQHHQRRPKPTPFKTAISTTAPRSAAARQTPVRPPRRRRKHRKRMSKAAMRAKILKEMV
ncbi:putative mediator of RNA polymerase II transcription subunit 12 [Kryptolebias marmoratus]|uniref:Platelet-derived growth factor beta polypeptide a n=1 Tax=Kryptolebias marmoratus TaxID=37003 RepID=A0A3Q3FPG8_KRYMA|nr:putative mediator of RNA polymerase II transcription subunit 12 [Kryptolebias marmoratus]XP_037830870.1 putative mediator of RNA polymerase II transcription subunit 12 [Kryptolebias marmoratus]